MTASFIWRFVWVYLGMVVAYAVIAFCICRPNYRLDRKVYIFVLSLYLLGVGSRFMGDFV